ncbi:zinc transporter [Actinomyces viscosus]|uniref:zinc transporter n=1 Tax=Actinomyces viscosus TaxID=1656 RepID=UPI001E623B0C|nr:zinc transporter [Actinomyces viscosus]
MSWDTQATDDYASIAGHASRSVTSNPESEDTGSGSSGDGVTTQYEDSSTWDEQPHQECSTEKDENGLAKYACNLANLSRPSQPQEPADGGGGPRTITVTTRQAATLIAQGSGITRQPPGPRVIISKAFIVYTDPSPRYQTTTILGTAVEVEFTPTSYTWDWGDGTTLTTTDPGHPYPHQSVTHYYQHTATAVTTTLTTTWTTRYRPQGETTWRTIDGTITTTETSTPYDLVRIVTYLTDDAEEAQGH